MNNTMIVVILRAGDVLVQEDDFQEVVSGTIECNADTGKFVKSEDSITMTITYEQTCSCHDAGKIVFESSEEFVGTWRDV